MIAIDVLNVRAHVGGQQLCNEEYEESRFKRGLVWIGVGGACLPLLSSVHFPRNPAEVLTFDDASAQADTMTPKVRMATEKICRGEYLFPRRYPAAIVVTLPKLRSMMWTGTDMLNANAQLFNMLTVKNSTALVTHLRNGTGDDRRK